MGLSDRISSDSRRSFASALRCPYCHDALDALAPNWIACGSCLARHHKRCWREHGACSSCGAVEALERSRERRENVSLPPRRRIRWALWVAAPLALLFAGVIGWDMRGTFDHSVADTLERARLEEWWLDEAEVLAHTGANAGARLRLDGVRMLRTGAPPSMARTFVDTMRELEVERLIAPRPSEPPIESFRPTTTRSGLVPCFPPEPHSLLEKRFLSKPGCND
jgi:hypothetical protein